MQHQHNISTTALPHHTYSNTTSTHTTHTSISHTQCIINTANMDQMYRTSTSIIQQSYSVHTPITHQ